MTELYKLADIQSSSQGQVGDKALYLGTLLQQHYPVIPGWIIPAETYHRFLQQIQWKEPFWADFPNSSLYFDPANPAQLQRVAQQIQQAVLATSLELPLTEMLSHLQAAAVILRPSLTILSPGGSRRPVTGLLGSRVCWAQPEAIVAKTKQVWADLFRATSLFYWQRSQIQINQLNLAVLVQPLKSAIAAGDLEIDTEIIRIRSVSGLGFSLARGEVIPTRIEASAVDRRIYQHYPGYEGIRYHLRSFQPTLQASPLSCLKTEFVSNPEVSQTLPTEVLMSLMQWAQQARNVLAGAVRLEWLLEPADTHTIPRLWITQAEPWVATFPDTHQLRAQSPALIEVDQQQSDTALAKGIGVSEGLITAPAIVITPQSLPITQIPPGRIIVAVTIEPAWLPLLKQAAGLIAEQGGYTSHGAILAREFGIPAIVGVEQATRLVSSGEMISLDGTRGEVYRSSHLYGGASSVPASIASLAHQFQPASRQQLSFRGAVTPIATQLLVNLSQSNRLAEVKDLPLDGVGLLRSELMILQFLQNRHPVQWLKERREHEFVEHLAALLVQVADAFAPRPVRYRSLDLRSQEFYALEGSPSRNIDVPTGLRGTLSYQLDPTLFDLELRALRLVHQAGFTNVHLLLPFVRTVEEFVFCRQRIEATGLLNQTQLQVWIMAEVPSVLFLLPEYVAAGVQGIAIGTNDLTQLLLGVDRDQPLMADMFDAHHPAVMAAIAQLIQTAHHHGIPCSICGEAPARSPALIESLVRWGIDSISVEPSALDQTYRTIVQAEAQLMQTNAP